MEFLNTHLLSLILFFPAFTALVIFFLPKDENKLLRWTALLASLVPFALSIVLWINFKSDASGYQFEEQYTWYAAINSSLHLGVDGLSLTMVLLTTLLTPLALLASFSISDRVKPYMMLFLFLETGMLGVFMAMDLLIFFVFWEVGLVPMYFLINQWGSANRNYASMKFMIYTMGGSLGLLLGIQLLGVLFKTFDLQTIVQQWTALDSAAKFAQTNFTVGQFKAVAFWAFVVAFAIKVPVWPFHTWLPDAHTEAPTAGSMILAGVLLKLGAYGFLRLVLPLYPEQAQFYAGALAFLAVAAIVFGAFAAYGQTDFKRLVAYSSVNHMGFVVLGIAVAAASFASTDPAVKESAVIAVNGSVLQMFAHGLSAAAMFALVGVVYDRAHTRDLTKLGGLWAVMPIYGGILIFSAMANLGLPGLAGFPAEFQVVRGAWPVFTAITALSMIGLLMTGAYILKGIQKVLHGPVNTELLHHAEMPDINRTETVALAPLLVLMLAIGLYPMWLMGVINESVIKLIGG